MNKVIITGADGFIGSHLTQHLAAQGYEVVALVAKGFSYDHLLGIEGVTCLEFTFDTLSSLSQHPVLAGATMIYHLAWAGVCTTNKNDAQKQAQNIQYGIALLEFAKENGIRRVVVPGSASEYACGQGVIDGHNAPAPSDLYSATKVATRMICQTYARQLGIEFIWTAITSIYGPGRNDNNLITYAIRTLLQGQKPSFTGLEQQWDYLYIDDLMSALQAIGEHGIDGKIYPIGSGEHQQMYHYVEMLRDKIDPKLPLGIGDMPYKNATIDNQILDINELCTDTGFKPRYSFEKGIELTIEYFKNLQATTK